MRLWKTLTGAFILLIAVLLIAGMGGEESTPEPETTPLLVSQSPSPTPTVDVLGGVVAGREVATVRRVVDGDTIELSDGRKLRYIGIDAPESVHPRKPVECIAPEATKKNIDLVEGRQVELEKDMSETDRLGRLLRYVYVDGVMVNDVLVREGFARASKYPPDVKYQAQFEEAQASARQNQWGIWSHLCGSPTPTVAGQKTETTQSTQATKKPAPTNNEPAVLAPTSLPEGECVIKGNINSKDEYIYHLPGCGSYKQTRIDPARGEQYFCTEQEARDAGWRKAGNC